MDNPIVWAALTIIVLTTIALVYYYGLHPHTSLERAWINRMAAIIVLENMRSTDIFTQKGYMRAAVRNKIIKKADELWEQYKLDEDKIIEYLVNKGLVTNSHKSSKSRIDTVARSINEYFKEKNSKNASAITDQGITPLDFFDLKKTMNGDTVGVYVIYNITKNKYYVGQAKRLYFRVNQHFTGHGNGDVYADYKYGDSFSITLHSLKDSGYYDLDKFEKDMIERYNAFADGYNKTIGNS